MKTINETLKDRERRYGTFKHGAMIAQNLKFEMTCSQNWELLSCDKREALQMIVTKISRILNGDPYHADNWHDIAGYATLIEDELNEQGSQR